MLRMQRRARFTCTGRSGRGRICVARRWLAPRSVSDSDLLPDDKPEDCAQAVANLSPAPLAELEPVKDQGLLEGFCAEPRPEEQIAVNSNGQMLFLPLADIAWVEAVEHGVEVHAGQATHRLRSNLETVAAKLPRDRFIRISPWTLVNTQQVKDIQPASHGNYEVRLRDGSRLALMRGYCRNLLRIA
jgi:DNA-binding LytR/AlgR family response regulator